MRYTAKPVQIEAYQIAEVIHVVKTGKRRTFLVLDGQPERTPLTKDVLTLAAPRRGDYFVIQDDGERSVLNPITFDARYRRGMLV